MLTGALVVYDAQPGAKVQLISIKLPRRGKANTATNPSGCGLSDGQPVYAAAHQPLAQLLDRKNDNGGSGDQQPGG